MCDLGGRRRSADGQWRRSGLQTARRKDDRLTDNDRSGWLVDNWLPYENAAMKTLTATDDAMKRLT